MKKVLSILLSAIIVFSACVITASAFDETKTHCGGEGCCDCVPTIVVHGISQSNVWLLDDNGNYVLDDDGNRIDVFPCYADTGRIIKRAIFPVLLSLITQHDVGLSKALKDVADICFYMNMNDNSGNESKYARLEEYPYSVAECNEYEKEQIFNYVPLQGIQEDHLYYFAYNSFGNNIKIVDRLYEYIEMVKKETGHDKINIVPISLGGTVTNGLLEYYSGSYEGRPSVYDSIHKMIYIIPALDGSSIVGDIFTKNITFLNKNYLYNGFLEGLMDENEARWIEIALRILPDEVLMKALNATVDELAGSIFGSSTNMWALVPSADYEKAADMWLTSPEKAEIRRQTDMYHTAQVNSKKNILELKKHGVQIFDIVDYGYPMYNIGNSWNRENTDGIIDVNSTSMGVHIANLGSKLPADYVQANTCCSVPGHNHISPDRVVDASTGLLPDTTFYFGNQGHESTADNDIIMALAKELIRSDNIKDVYSDPRFPQFNGSRDTGDFTDALNNCKNALPFVSDEADKKELEQLIEKGEKLLKTTVVEPGECEEYIAETEALLVKLGLRDADKPKDPAVPKKISRWLLNNFGTNGFSEYPVAAVKNIFTIIKGALCF